MTSQAAYYSIGKRFVGRQHGFDLEDWLNGEEEVLKSVDYFTV